MHTRMCMCTHIHTHTRARTRGIYCLQFWIVFAFAHPYHMAESMLDVLIFQYCLWQPCKSNQIEFSFVLLTCWHADLRPVTYTAQADKPSTQITDNQ
jgi:hypothetical protein